MSWRFCVLPWTFNTRELCVNDSSALLTAQMTEHQIELPQDQIEQLANYCKLLWDWNEKINMTRHNTFELFVARDLIDTLAFAEFLGQGEKVLDVGSGGGVPGVVLSIIRPDLRVTLCESVEKKARVLTDIVKQLKLPTHVYHARAEDLLKKNRYDTLTIRAVARLTKLLGWFKPHWRKFDRILLIKGPKWVDERGEARHLGLMNKLALRRLKSYPMVGTESESVLLQICKKENDKEN
jgi:16S rRNA (guanine527-N7)-methyltransferase